MRYSKLVLLLTLLFIILLVGCNKSVQSVDNIAINQNIKNIKIVKAVAIVEPKNEKINEVVKSADIFEASKRGDLKSVQQYIENGVDINLLNDDGFTAIMLASIDGHLEIVKYLVENGANVNIKITSNEGDYWRTSLHFATLFRHLEVVKYLVENGADINATDNYHNTSLMNASEKGYKKIVKYLMESGADINFGDFYGNTALIIAQKHEHTEIIKLLEDEAKNMETLIEGSRNGDLEKVKESVKKLVNINFQDKNENTVLILASIENHIEVVKYLIESGADLNIKNNVEYTALMYAIQNDSTDIAKLLIDAGAEEDSFQKNKEKIIKANNFYGYKGEIEIYISYYRSDYSSFGDQGKNNVEKKYKGYLESVLGDEGNQKIIFYKNDYVKELRLEKKNNSNLIFYDKKKVYDSEKNSDDDFNNLKEKYPIYKYPESVLSFLYYGEFPEYFIPTDVFLSLFLEGYLEHDRDYWYGMESELQLNDDYGVTSFYVGDYSIDYMWIDNVPYGIEIYTGAEVITITFLDEKGWLRR